jgi:hypothetical protein
VRRYSSTLPRKFAAAKRGAMTACSPHTEQLSGFVHFHRQLRERQRGSPIHTHRRPSLVTNLPPIAIGSDASLLARDAQRPAAQPPDAEPKYTHGCRITAVPPHHLLASTHTRSATSHHTEVQSSACGATTLPFMLCSTACVYNCRGRQTAEAPSDGESCIPVPNLMQMRAANDDAELILLSSYSSQGPLPNQQPRRGLV